MKGWKRFGNYMPMLATVAVVGCVAMALKGYAAPVYEVEQPVCRMRLRQKDR